MARARGDCHVCGAERVDLHLIAACEHCRAAAGRYVQPADGRRSRRGAPPGQTREQRAVCSFCGRPPHEVRRVFSGPWSLICDGCVALASEAMREDQGDGWNPHTPRPPRGLTKPWPAAGDEPRETTDIGRPPEPPASAAGARRTRSRR